MSLASRIKPFRLSIKGGQEKDDLKLDSPVSKQILECVGLLTTSFELEDGRLKLFLDRTLKTLQKVHLDFVIFLNKTVDIEQLIEPYRKFFNVVVVYHNIPKEDDVRILTPNTLEYGGCSGPNIQFLKSARYCKKYNTTLFLETDCILEEGWLNACINYVRCSGTFLISGATYDGLWKIPLGESAYFHHINGVAFYNTMSPYFEKLLDETETYIKDSARRGLMVQYDVGISQSIENKLKAYDNYYYWRFMYRQIIKNTLIVNCSLPSDKDIEIEDILFKFPSAVIIHRKD